MSAPAATTAAPVGQPSGMRRDTAMVSVCMLLSRLSGFGRVMATAAVVGSGALGDVYQTANMIPNLLFELVAGGVLQAVLLPSFVSAKAQGGDAALGEATRATAGVIVAGLAIVAAVGMALSPLIARVLVASEGSDSLASSKVDVLVPMVLVFVPQLVCYGVATVTSVALNARGRYVAAALAPAVNNIIVIIACIAFRAARGDQVADLDLTPGQFLLLAGGTTVGVVVFSLTPAIALRAAGVAWWPQWRPQHPAVHHMRRSFGWATLSIVGTLVPTAAALALGNGAAGGVAVFVYAFAFYVLPHALVAVTVATTLAPRVAEQWQSGRVTDVRRSIDGALKSVVPLLALAGAGMVALSWPLTRLLGGFGQTASQGLAPIAHALAAFGPGLVGYGVAFVMIRVLFAIGDVRTASTMMIVSAVVGVGVMWAASAAADPSERAAALAIGYGASQTVAAAMLVLRAHRLTRAMGGRTVVRLVGETAIATALAFVTMLTVVSQFHPSRRDALPAFLLAGTAGVAVFAVVVGLLRRDQLLGARARRGGRASS